MVRNFTLLSKGLNFLISLTTFLLLSVQTHATPPKLKFTNAQLVFGIEGEKNAVYKFTNVTEGIDAFVKIENLVNGATLINIDEEILGYTDAWQPVVGGPGVFGSSYIKWDIDFKTSDGATFIFTDLDASAIDIDGDNVRVREFVAINGQTSYKIPTEIPSRLSIEEVSAIDNANQDDISPNDLKALGPVSNRLDIDTFSQDVRIDYNFNHVSKIKIYTGSQIDDNGNMAAISLNRYHCIYFMKIVASFASLPVTYHSFVAVANEKNNVELFWIIEEKRNEVFEIERSFDLKEFKVIGMVIGEQSDNGISGSYNFIDRNAILITHKEVFYRLKNIDLHGVVSYSPIKKVLINTSETMVQVYPNPFIAKLNVNFKADASGSGEISLLNTSGNVIKHLQSKIVNGSNNITIEGLDALAPGIYVINMKINGSFATSQKLVK